MAKRTTTEQRLRFYKRHIQGETYDEIAEQEGFSKECVRHWCRHQRDGKSVQTCYARSRLGQLSQFSPLVRYIILRLRLQHPRWGPSRLRNGLRKRLALRGLRLPSPASIGRYLHQWDRFQRRRKKKRKDRRPDPPQRVHQRYQIDFKLGIRLANGCLVNLHTVRDPVGEACIGAFVYPAPKDKLPKHVPEEEARATLRKCFAGWQCLPEEVQTDGEPTLIGNPNDNFPSRFTLWLVGLGIDHRIIRAGVATDNAEVERCHRTLDDYAIIGNEDVDYVGMQAVLDQSVDELNYELPSRAEGCRGLPPIQAHPELLQPQRPFRPEDELLHFDLDRVDAYLASLIWERKVGKTGQISIGGQHQYYSVGRDFARQSVLVSFDPQDRHFVCYVKNEDDQPGDEIRRWPARNLEISDLTGLYVEPWPIGLGPQQLRFPLPAFKGVFC